MKIINIELYNDIIKYLNINSPLQSKHHIIFVKLHRTYFSNSLYRIYQYNMSFSLYSFIMKTTNNLNSLVFNILSDSLYEQNKY